MEEVFIDEEGNLILRDKHRYSLNLGNIDEGDNRKLYRELLRELLE